MLSTLRFPTQKLPVPFLDSNHASKLLKFGPQMSVRRTESPAFSRQATQFYISSTEYNIGLFQGSI